MKTGDYVCLAYGSANRDERRFPDPDIYDIRRRPRGHLGFGGGVHGCLGAMVARMAVRSCSRSGCQDPGVHACRARARLDAINDVPQPDEPPSRPRVT